MRESEYLDFSGETNIKESLFQKCMDRKKEIEDSKKSTRRPITFDELKDSKNSITKMGEGKQETKPKNKKI